MTALRILRWIIFFPVAFAASQLVYSINKFLIIELSFIQIDGKPLLFFDI